MSEEQGDRIVELLETIIEKLDSINFTTGGVKSECENITSRVYKLGDIEDNVDIIRRNMK